MSRMLAEERSHASELERIIEAARAREAVAAREHNALLRDNLQIRDLLRRAGHQAPSAFEGSTEAGSPPASSASARLFPPQVPAIRRALLVRAYRGVVLHVRHVCWLVV
jgi:hypothetical protein